jgi:HD-GYP domain-containing protein (c-di-GMP phosphodiesterase class II)
MARVGKRRVFGNSGGAEKIMNESQSILSKIAALRQEASVGSPGEVPGSVDELTSKVNAGIRQNVLLDGSLRKLADPAQPVAEARLPRHLTGRARRLLEQGRDLLQNLRHLGGRLAKSTEEGTRDADPLVRLFRETVAMADTSLRLVQAFPDAPSAQLRLCAGLEGILADIGARTSSLADRVERRCHESERIELLSDCLDRLDTDRLSTAEPVHDLADEVLEEAHAGEPLRLLEGGRKKEDVTKLSAEEGRLRVAQQVARHGLNVAQVAARVVRFDPELRDQARTLVVAALIHDVGMLRVPAAIVLQPGTLDDAGRRAVEAHTLAVPDALSRLFANMGYGLKEAVVGHHERLDGTGYPSGWRELQVPPLVRLLAVCDVYAALSVSRPHRPAKTPRDALADTLLLAEQGGLDPERARRLLDLSFYPPGTVVELTDGALGVVVATHMGRRDVNTPSCPVVALLTDAQRRPLPVPKHLDLKECEGRHVVRALPSVEGRDLLGRRFPDLAA